jgi:hypothetical protein
VLDFSATRRPLDSQNSVVIGHRFHCSCHLYYKRLERRACYHYRARGAIVLQPHFQALRRLQTGTGVA